MPTPMPRTKFTVENHVLLPLGNGLLLRDDRMLGFTSRFYKPDTLDACNWYTLQQVAERAQVPVSEIATRVRNLWGAADIIKPMSWGRVVEARRNGITRNNVHKSLYQWSRETGLTQPVLWYRLNKGWPIEDVLRPLDNRRRPMDTPIGSVPLAPTPTPEGGARGRFFYKGAVDTLGGHCRAKGLSVFTVRARLRKGLSLEQAMAPDRLPRSDIGKTHARPNPLYR